MAAGAFTIPENNMTSPSPMQPTQMPTMGQPGFYVPGNPLYQYHDPGASTQPLFNSAISASAPSNGVSPGYQSILDTIRQQQDYATNLGVANAQSLAAKRGLSGSSIEQFGTNEAVGQASRAAQDAGSNVLLQNQAQQNQLQQLQAQLYGSRAQSLAGLGSDELTSLRNADYSRQYLQLQQQLGQEGLDVSRQNISANQDIADQTARNNLIGSGASILAPYLLPKLLGGGGGIPGSFGVSGAGGASGLLNIGGQGSGFLGFGGGGAGGLPGLQGGVPLVGGGQPGLFGAGGTFLNTAGTSAMGAGNVLPGLAGWQLGTHTFGDNRYTNTGGIIGGIGGSLFGPAGSAAGAFLGAGAGKLADRVATGVSDKFGNTAGSIMRYTNPLTAIPDAASKAKNVVNKVADTVSSVFPF